VHQTTLVADYTPYDEAFAQAKQHLLHGVLAHGDVAQSMRLLFGLLAKQAALLSYVDIFYWSALLGVLCTALTFTLKRVKAGGPVIMH
jgi:hypothetical protein